MCPLECIPLCYRNARLYMFIKYKDPPHRCQQSDEACTELVSMLCKEPSSDIAVHHTSAEHSPSRMYEDCLAQACWRRGSR